MELVPYITDAPASSSNNVQIAAYKLRPRKSEDRKITPICKKKKLISKADSEPSTTISNNLKFNIQTNLRVLMFDNVQTRKPCECVCEEDYMHLSDQSENVRVVSCQARDSVGDVDVGCAEELSSSCIIQHRPSTNVPYMMICNRHLERIRRHNCCPGCGRFFSKGKIATCRWNHQYHLECSRNRGCLHCGDMAEPTIKIVKMYSPHKAMYLSSPVKKRRKTSRMTVHNQTSAPDLENLPFKLSQRILQWTPPLNKYSPKFTNENLLDAIKSGNAVLVLDIMHSGLNINFRDENKQTFLHIAAGIGHTDIVHLLLQRGMLIDDQDSDLHTALHLAIRAFNDQLTHYLVIAGASVLIKAKNGMTPLHTAAQLGNLKACQILLNPPRVPCDYINSLSESWGTPLTCAADCNRVDVVRFLLLKGAKTGIVDSHGNTALHLASSKGYDEIVELLVPGRDVTSTNNSMDTPLHLAARHNHYSCVIYLIASGAPCNVRNRKSQTPKDCAEPDSMTAQAISFHEQISNALTLTKPPNHLLSSDISRGYERNPVRCTNSVDASEIPNFRYISQPLFATSVVPNQDSIVGCDCDGECNNYCTCINRNTVIRYDKCGRANFRIPLEMPKAIYECSLYCKCHRMACSNRIVQKGNTEGLFEVFRTREYGWGLKTLKPITKGSYVCEYLGEIISSEEAERRMMDNYFFDLDKDDQSSELFCIDAHEYGNISRFINHQCEPNLIAVRVWLDTWDPAFPRIALFACKDIPPDTELGYDYGDQWWGIKKNRMNCKCGSISCKWKNAEDGDDSHIE